MANENNPLGFGRLIPSKESLIARAGRSTPEPPAPPVKEPKTSGESPSMFEPRTARYRYEDLVLPENVFRELEILQSMIHHHSLVYQKWGMDKVDPYGRQIAFNLYGPSGTGKTMIVEALCERWKVPLIDINLSQLESKYVGDTGKNIAAAFATAQKYNALLFFDEADTVLGRRLSEVTQSADSSVNTARGVMLKQLEQHSGIVAFATNFAHNYDTAFVRRILKHIHVPLPDTESRKQLWMKKIPRQVPGRDGIDFDLLARESKGFSGGDILIAVKNALFDAARIPQNPLLTNEMLQQAIQNGISAKENVGRWGESQTTFRELSVDDARKEGIL